jgi:hypothetical protein
MGLGENKYLLLTTYRRDGTLKQNRVPYADRGVVITPLF